MDDLLDELYPQITLETDDLIMEISVKKDYSQIKDLDERKKEFINDLKDFIDEFNETPESGQFMAFFWLVSGFIQNLYDFHYILFLVKELCFFLICKIFPTITWMFWQYINIQIYLYYKLEELFQILFKILKVILSEAFNEIAYSEFTRNYADLGPAIYTDDIRNVINNTVFLKNKQEVHQADLVDQYELSYERLTEIYAEFVNILNFWRNKDISEAAAKL